MEISYYGIEDEGDKCYLFKPGVDSRCVCRRYAVIKHLYEKIWVTDIPE